MLYLAMWNENVRTAALAAILGQEAKVHLLGISKQSAGGNLDPRNFQEHNCNTSTRPPPCCFRHCHWGSLTLIYIASQFLRFSTSANLGNQLPAAEHISLQNVHHTDQEAFAIWWVQKNSFCLQASTVSRPYAECSEGAVSFNSPQSPSSFTDWRCWGTDVQHCPQSHGQQGQNLTVNARQF